MECCDGVCEPERAMKRRKILYTIAIYTGTGIQKPDYLCTIDADPASPTYSKVIHRLEMPDIGDELHHMGWNACSSCFDDGSMSRSYLLVPGVRSSNIYIVDTATDPAPRLFKTIRAPTSNRRPICRRLTPCVPRLGNHHLDAWQRKGRPRRPPPSEQGFRDTGAMGKFDGRHPFGYDFWYQPRHNVWRHRNGPPQTPSCRGSTLKRLAT